MPMIDVYVTAGTFPDKHQLATDLAVAVMTIEQVPDIPMFRQNTAASIHELPPRDLSTTTAKATTCGERPASIEDVAACHAVEDPFGCHGLLLPPLFLREGRAPCA